MSLIESIRKFGFTYIPGELPNPDNHQEFMKWLQDGIFVQYGLSALFFRRLLQTLLEVEMSQETPFELFIQWSDNRGTEDRVRGGNPLILRLVVESMNFEITTDVSIYKKKRP